MKKSAKKFKPLIIARKKAGFTQATVAKQFDVSLRTYCNWEAGATSPDSDLLMGVVQWLESFAPAEKAPPTGRKAPVRCAALVSARKKAGLTQLQAARLLRVSPRAYQHWEAGTTLRGGGFDACIAALGKVPPPEPCVMCGHVGRAV